MYNIYELAQKDDKGMKNQFNELISLACINKTHWTCNFGRYSENFPNSIFSDFKDFIIEFFLPKLHLEKHIRN